MVEKLNGVMINEFNALNGLLVVLKEQNDAYVKKDIFALEGVVKKIQNVNVTVAEFEVERRKLVGNKSMRELIAEINNSELTENFNKISSILPEIQAQKENNEFLIKQGLRFTNRMLNIFRPSKTANTYNNIGKIRK